MDEADKEFIRAHLRTVPRNMLEAHAATCDFCAEHIVIVDVRKLKPFRDDPSLV